MADASLIYLDHAAATPLDPKVFEAMQPYLTGRFYNPSATYNAAHAVHNDMTEARVRVAHYFGARSNEILFTAGGTEANNLAIHGVMRQFPAANCIVLATEHDSVLKPAGLYRVKKAPVTADGRMVLAGLERLIDDYTILVSIQYANNEIGTIQPLKTAASLIQSIKKQRQNVGNGLPLYLHADACQAPAYLDIHAARLGVDMMTINASKIYGPKQVGALYVKAGIRLQPQILGGGQERGQRSGTENVAGVVGLAVALGLAQERRTDESRRLQQIQALFYTQLKAQIPSAVINGSRKYRLPNNIHVTFPGYDNERLMIQLDALGIMCATGSACSASSDEPSHVLRAIGLTDEQSRSSLRFTMGRSTTEGDIRSVATELRKMLN